MRISDWSSDVCSSDLTKELRGAAKSKESAEGLLKAGKILGKSYGKPYINFGEPIVLQSYADAHMPGWRTTIAEDSESMPESFKSFVSKLALENSRRINADRKSTRLNSSH